MVAARIFVGLITACLTLGGLTSHCRAQEEAVRVRAVTLEGDPISGVDVRFRDSKTVYPSEENLTNDNGVAEVYVKPKDDTGLAEIRINMEGETNREIDFIGRVKKVEWTSKDEFADGFAVPLWQPGDVKSLAHAVIRNPSHIAVAVRLGDNYGAQSRVIAEVEKDVDWWLTNVLGDLPMIVDPPLARALNAQTQPGEIIPPHFDAAMRNVFAEVQRQKEAARVCRMFPQGVPQQPPPQNPQQNPLPPDEPPYYPPKNPLPADEPPYYPPKNPVPADEPPYYPPSNPVQPVPEYCVPTTQTIVTKIPQLCPVVIYAPILVPVQPRPVYTLRPVYETIPASTTDSDRSTANSTASGTDSAKTTDYLLAGDG